MQNLVLTQTRRMTFESLVSLGHSLDKRLFFSFCGDDAIKYTVDNGMGVNNDTVMTGVEQRVGINAV